MKWSVVFFFCLLAHAERSFARKHAHNGKVEVGLIGENYINFVRKLPVPTLEYGDRAAGNFEKMYSEAVLVYSRNLVSNLYAEAKYAGEQLIDDIERDMDRFRKDLKLVTYTSQPNCLDEALKQINDQLYIFLELKPEDLEYHRPELPPLPKQQVKLESRTDRRTAKEIFSNFVATTDSIAYQVFAYLNSLFLRGWSYVRPDFEIVRIQIYEEVLNGRVMHAYRQAVIEVSYHSDLVQHNVSPETWKSFTSAADHIIAISHDI